VRSTQCPILRSWPLHPWRRLQPRTRVGMATPTKRAVPTTHGIDATLLRRASVTIQPVRRRAGWQGCGQRDLSRVPSISLRTLCLLPLSQPQNYLAEGGIGCAVPLLTVALPASLRFCLFGTQVHPIVQLLPLLAIPS
jgi:hypothetical protein